MNLVNEILRHAHEWFLGMWVHSEKLPVGRRFFHRQVRMLGIPAHASSRSKRERVIVFHFAGAI